MLKYEDVILYHTKYAKSTLKAVPSVHSTTAISIFPFFPFFPIFLGNLGDYTLNSPIYEYVVWGVFKGKMSVIKGFNGKFKNPCFPPKF